MLLVFSASALFSIFFLGFIRQGFHENTDVITPFCLLLSTGLAFYFWRWYPSPSYNWLNLIACLLAGSGLLGYSMSSPQRKLFLLSSALLLGLGFGFTFLVKPSTSVLLAILILWWLASNWRPQTVFHFVFTAMLSCMALLGWHIWEEPGGLSNFLENLRLGFSYTQILQSGHGITRLVLRAIKDLVLALTSGLLLVLLFSRIFGSSDFNLHAKDEAQISLRRNFFTLLATAVFLLIIVSIRPGELLAGGYIALAAAYSYLLLSDLKVSTAVNDISAEKHFYNTLAPALLLCGLNFAYGFGSSIGYTKILTGAHILLASACLYLGYVLDKHYLSRKFSLLVYFFIVCTLVLLVRAEIREPYRLISSLDTQSVTAEFYQGYTSLEVDPLTAEYVENLIALASLGDWQARTPLIDLSGDTPGALLILNAKVLGRPWFLGKYAGANQYAEEVLSRAKKQDLDEAWLLTAAHSPLKIDEGILENFGSSFPEDYIHLGDVKTAYRNELQSLWKPATD